MDEIIMSGDIMVYGKDVPMHEFVGAVTDLADQLKSEKLIITDMKLSLSFVGGEYTAKGSIVVDREDFDKITNHKYVKDDNVSRILKFLQPYAYQWMTEIEINEFIDRFISLYNEIGFDTKFIPPPDPVKFCLEEYPMDINQYFIFHNIPYEFRYACGKYQLQQRHLSMY